MPSWSRRRADRKSTRLNSSHVEISYAVFCLKKKKKKYRVMSLKHRNNQYTTPSPRKLSLISHILLLLEVFFFPLVFSLSLPFCFFFFNDTATTEIYTLSLHDALPICWPPGPSPPWPGRPARAAGAG